MITLIRVAYGKKDTPKELREYQIGGSGPVGTINEFKLSFPGETFKIVERKKSMMQTRKELYGWYG
jgi:hypothetical protein